MRAQFAGTFLLITSLFAAGALADPWQLDTPDSDLAKAKAAADKYQVEEAVALYTKAIASGTLSPQQLAFALHGRG